MNYRRTHTNIFLAGLLCTLAACTEYTGKSRGPITLGDPATIITETDSQYLQDMVPALEPVQQPEPQPLAAVKADTPKPAEKPVQKDTVAAKPATPAKAVNGLNVAFREVTISIPNITTRSYGRGDLQKANSATYELRNGNLNGNQLLISGGKATRVQQRYQTVVIVKNGGKTLPLTSLNTYSSAWQTLKGSSTYPISGLDERRLGFTKATPAAIRNAVQKAARSKRMSRKEEQQWISAVRNVRGVNQSPCAVVLRSVMWRIEGTSSDGKKFNKEIRIDMPM